jgi:hypothetical protein
LLTSFAKSPFFVTIRAPIAPNGCRICATSFPAWSQSDSRKGIAMRRPEFETGFIPSTARPLGTERHTVALAELMATIGIALGTLVAGTVVGVGIAHAEIIQRLAPREGSVFAVASIVFVIFGAIGVVTALSVARERASMDD